MPTESHFGPKTANEGSGLSSSNLVQAFAAGPALASAAALAVALGSQHPGVRAARLALALARALRAANAMRGPMPQVSLGKKPTSAQAETIPAGWVKTLECNQPRVWRRTINTSYGACASHFGFAAVPADQPGSLTSVTTYGNFVGSFAPIAAQFQRTSGTNTWSYSPAVTGVAGKYAPPTNDPEEEWKPWIPQLQPEEAPAPNAPPDPFPPLPAPYDLAPDLPTHSPAGDPMRGPTETPRLGPGDMPPIFNPLRFIVIVPQGFGKPYAPVPNIPLTPIPPNRDIGPSPVAPPEPERAFPPLPAPNPAPDPAPDVQPVPQEEFQPLPVTDLPPVGEPLYQPGPSPIQDPRHWPGYEPVPFPMPSPRPAPSPRPIDRPVPAPRPWERPSENIRWDPQVGPQPVKDRLPHKNLPPRATEREIKTKWRTQVPLVRLLGEATEYCDLIDSLFDALPDMTKAKYDSTVFLRNEKMKLPELVWEAAKGNFTLGNKGKKITGKDWHAARKAFNERNEKVAPAFRSKWGRKATCQTKARAVYENWEELANDQAMGEVFKNIIKNEFEDRAIGKLGKGAAQFNNKVSKSPLGLQGRGL